MVLLGILACNAPEHPPGGDDSAGGETDSVDTGAGYDGPCLADVPAYEDVSSAWGLTDTTDAEPYPTGGSGIAVADLDEDGADDVVLAVRSGDLVVHWNRGGVFEAETVAGIASPTSVAALDVDGDQHLDLLVSAPLVDDPLRYQLELLRGDGAGTFTSTDVGVPSSKALAFDAADPDHDGDPDVYVATDGADVLLRNDAGDLVVDDSLDLGDWTWKSWIGHWLDVDGDGWSDLLVANDLQSDYGATRLYANDTGSLAEGTPPTTINAMGGSIVDHDRDGDPDLYITGTGPDGLYANDDGWIDVSAAAAAMGDNDLGRMHLGSVAADLDNDGWTDLVAVAGRWGGDDGLLRNQDLVEPDAIRLNTEGHFAAADLGFGDDGDNTSVVAADLDGDGTLELVEGTVGGPSHVWRSPCVAAWSVEVEPVGGLGSTVIAHTSAGDRYGRVALGTGLLGTGPPRAWIGLGDARLQGLTVRWPDGIEQEVETTTPGRIRVERE